MATQKLEKKTATVTFRIRESTRRDLDRAAFAAGLTLTEWFEKKIGDALKRLPK